jgi:hypothetical protein
VYHAIDDLGMFVTYYDIRRRVVSTIRPRDQTF